MAVYVNGQSVGVTKEVSKQDMLQARVDATNSCDYLFYKYGGSTLDFIENLDTSNATSMISAFEECKNVTGAIKVDCTNATDTSRMFYYCTNVTEIDVTDTSKSKNMNSMFFNCYKLTKIDGLDTTSATNFNAMFWACYELLDVPKIDTSKATSIRSMYSNCRKLTKPITIDASNATQIYGVCSNCEEVPSISVSNTQNCTNMDLAFQVCKKVETIGTVDMLKATTASSMFNKCSLLKNLTLKNIKINLQIGGYNGGDYGHLLTNASLLNTAQELWDNTDNALGGARTLKMSTPSKTAIQSIYVKLVDVTDEMIAQDQYIANKKPCIECASTDEGAMTLEEYIISKNWTIG